MKEFIEFIKKLWENKRTRALAILIIYVIFFIFVFMLIGSDNNIDFDNTKPLENIENYKYDIEFIGEHNFSVKDGIIIYDEISYNIDNLPEELLNYDVSIYTSSNVSKLIDASILESTNYVDKVDTYLIKSNDFEKVIYGNIIDSSYDIRISVQKENMNHIVIDLNEYYGYKVEMNLRS